MRRLAALLLLASATSSASPLFEQDEVLEISLAGPLSTVVGDTEDRNEYPFVLTVEGSAIGVDVRVRGLSRVRVCNFPPIRLDFSSSDASGTVFAGQRRLKVVTHCKRSADYEQNVLEEYAAYRIFNVLSNVSFRVRLARIRYVDTADPGAEDLVRYAFFIESDEAMAKRNAGSLINARRVTKNYLDPAQTALAYIFQFLIGNTDWSLVRALEKDTCCHNGLLVGIEGRHYYVPYDFDLAGLVNARYAKPDPSLRIRRVTQRRYRGYCMPREALGGALKTVLGHREDILRVVDDLPQLSQKDIKSLRRYLEDFFALAADKDKLLGRFERRCL